MHSKKNNVRNYFRWCKRCLVCDRDHFLKPKNARCNPPHFFHLHFSEIPLHQKCTTSTSFTVRVALFKTLDILRFVPTCLFPACSDSYHVAMVYHSQVSQKLLSFDPERLGNRGPRRYSFGGASKTLHMMPLAEEGRMSPHTHTMGTCAYHISFVDFMMLLHYMLLY